MEARGSELIIHTYTNHVVGTAIDFLAISGLFLVVAIDAAEVTGIQTHLLADVPGSAETHGIAVAGK